ncbi:MAG: glycoside hydrolase family 88 protein [Acidobacteriota bacterium]|nr:glycoside hydrolase family 88 protein [Acidobacteriota bacterium]
MTEITRRHMLRLCAAAPLATRLAFAERAGHSTADITDWSRLIIAATMDRKPDPAQLGGWGYQVALYLYGMYLVYQRTGDRSYLTYLQAWVDRHVDESGAIDRKITALDDILPGNLLLVLFKATGKAKYKIAAQTIRTTFDTYPRTEDGGFWHALSRQHQLWLDGMYMSMPFLVRYGAAFGERKYTIDEAAKQLMIYARHLNDPATGLMFHAYDESGVQPWADPVTHHSAILWCRAIGWFGMALVDVLELMPKDHLHRKDLINQVRQLAGAYEKFQDPATGLWYQVVNRGDLADNWHETSSSSMYCYMLSRGIQRGYLPKHFSSLVEKGYKGVLAELARDEKGNAHIANICEGTNVGDLAFYFARPHSTDDFHGLGAFLIMNEQLRYPRA